MKVLVFFVCLLNVVGKYYCYKISCQVYLYLLVMIILICINIRYFKSINFFFYILGVVYYCDDVGNYFNLYVILIY